MDLPEVPPPPVDARPLTDEEIRLACVKAAAILQSGKPFLVSSTIVITDANALYNYIKNGLNK